MLKLTFYENVNMAEASAQLSTQLNRAQNFFPPGATPPQISLYADDSEKARVVANVEAGVIANVLTCNGKWCWVSMDQYKGYVQQKKLWGVYEAEILK